jgi:hypothetical protein
MAETLELWRHAWRNGFAPLLSTGQVEALRQGLVSDDDTLKQGLTVTPPPLQCVADWPVEEACPVAYCGWKGAGLKTVEEVEGFFARKCWEADQRLGEPAACRFFINWVDDTPRDEMRKELLIEVQRTIRERLEGEAADEATQQQ